MAERPFKTHTWCRQTKGPKDSRRCRTKERGRERGEKERKRKRERYREKEIEK